VVFLSVEVSFFAANLTKIVHGGWLPLAVAAIIFTVLMTWRRGRVIVTRNRTAKEGSLRDFVAEVHEMEPSVYRVPGTAVFLNAVPDTAPLALRANVEHNHTLHEAVIIFSIEFARVPHIPPDERLVIDDLGDPDDGITHVTALFGFQDEPDVPQALRSPAAAGIEVPTDIDDATYFLSRMTIVRTGAPGMPAWQKRLFLSLAHNAANPVEYFNLPIDRTISMGAQIEF
jgi:KUP system potassium uptake protein